MGWMDQLPEKLRISLEKILDMTNRHEEAYMEAENASVGQLWVAIAHLNQQVEDLENIVNAQRKALNNLDQDVNVNQHLDSNLEESLKRY
jgi:flagellar biosynthesis chaperone FliJ